MIFSAAGFANVLIFRSKAPNVMKLVTDQEDDSTETAVSIVAKQIIREVKVVEVDKSKYDIRLMSLLSQLSPKLNRIQPI